MRALRLSLPPHSGAELFAAGDPPRLSLTTNPSTTTPELLAVRPAIETFNRDYAARATALNRELAELRRQIATLPRPGPGSGKSVDDLLQDFTTAALRQASAESYRDLRAAALEPGLSPEQRHLLFDRLGEKSSSLVLEF